MWEKRGERKKVFDRLRQSLFFLLHLSALDWRVFWKTDKMIALLCTGTKIFIRAVHTYFDVGILLPRVKGGIYTRYRPLKKGRNCLQKSAIGVQIKEKLDCTFLHFFCNWDRLLLWQWPLKQERKFCKERVRMENEAPTSFLGACACEQMEEFSASFSDGQNRWGHGLAHSGTFTHNSHR